MTFAGPRPGAHAGAVCYGPALNAAAMPLSCYGNVPAERCALQFGMLIFSGFVFGEKVKIKVMPNGFVLRR